MIRIDDPADPRLDDYRYTRDRDLSGSRASEGLFVGETLPIVEAMLERHPSAVRSVLASDRMAARVAESVRGRAPLLVAEESLVSGIAGFEVHRGVLAIGERAPLCGRSPLDPPFREARLLLACDGVGNMDNMGALFRIAAAFGVGGVLLSRDAHDPLYRKSIRVSMGHALRIPFARCEDLAASVIALREARRASMPLAVLGADAGTVSGAPAEPVGRAAARLQGAAMLVVGGEHGGITAPVRASCDALVRIPMAPGVDSLNVAVAAAVCLSRLAEAQG